MSIILSVADSLIASGIDQFAAEKWQDRKRDKLLQKDYNTWLEREKDQQHYNALDRALSNSNIIQEFITYTCYPDRQFSISDRIEALFHHGSFTHEEKAYISDAVENLLSILKNDLLRADDKDINRLASRIESNNDEIIEKLDSLDKKISTANTNTVYISALHGETIPEENQIFRRKIFPNADEYSTQDKRVYSLPIDVIQEKRKIIVIGEAGYGKTYLLFQICHEAKEKGLHALYFSLKRTNYPDVLNLLNTKQLSVDCKTVLILDGLDEIKSDIRNSIITTIQGIDIHYPNLYVVLSIRTNFYTSVIEGINAYEIKPFDDDDRKEYIQANGINYESFINCIYEQQLYDMYQNAFYFTEMIRMWQENEELPNKADFMEKVTDSRIKADIIKFENIIPSPERKIKKYFQDIALIMQCMQVYTLSSAQIEKIVGQDILMLLEYNGLWECIEGQWSFAHNIIKEYYVARLLSKLNLDLIKRYVSETIDGEEYIRPSWYNVLSILLLSNKGRDLVEWVYNSQPEIIIGLEPDRFTVQQRTKLYIRIMEAYKSNNEWFLWDYSYRKRLASLCANESTVEYIINELRGSITDRQKQNLLRSIVHFDSFYGKEQVIQEIISDIILNEELSEFLRIDAIDVVEDHTSTFAGISNDIINLFRDDLDENMTYAILKTIDAYGESENHMDIILKAYEKYDGLENHLLSLSILFKKILQGITTKQSAHKILQFIISHPEKVYHDDDCRKAFSVCCKIGAHHYSGDNDEILECITSILNIKVLHDFHYCFDSIKQYMVDTHTESIVYNHIVSVNSKWDVPYIISGILCKPLLQLIISEYKSNRVEDEQIKELIHRTQGKEEFNKALRIAFFSKTGETIPDTPLYHDIKKAEALGHQMYFNALFNKEQYAILINKLGQLFGSDSIISKIKGYEFHEQFRDKPVLRDTYYGLRHLFGSEKDNTSFSTVINKIHNWNIFLIIAVDNALSNNSKDISVSGEQKKAIEQAVIDTLKPDAFRITVKDATHYSYSSILPPSLRIIRIMNLDCPDDLIIRMLIVPFHIWDKEEHRSIPNYIIAHLQHETLVKCIINNIKTKAWNSLVAPHYINFCIDNDIREVKQDIIEFLFDSERNRFGINDGIEYLCKLFSYKDVEEYVLPRCNEDELLTSIAYHIPFNIQSELLEEKMLKEYRTSQNIKWLHVLIHRSNVEALEEYYQLACSSNQIPDMTEGSQIPYIADAFRSISNIKALPMLVKLMQLTFNPGFKDKEVFGLFSGCWDAIKNIANDNYEDVISCLHSVKINDHSPFDDAISDLLNTIKAEQKRIMDTPMSFDTALALLSF